MNNLVTIIDKEGTTTYLGEINSEENIDRIDIYPRKIMHDYFEENYHINFTDISYDEYGYYFTLYGNVLYLNADSYGIVYVPDIMSIEQQEAYDKLVTGLNKPVTLRYNMNQEEEQINFDEKKVENGNRRLCYYNHK